MTSTTEYVLPLACSCSNCDWRLCSMKTQIKKDIIVCGCGEKNRPQPFVYTCTTCSPNETAKPIEEPTTCCEPEVKKPCYEIDETKDKKSEPPKKDLKKPSRDKLNKQAGKKSQKNVKIDCVSKECTTNTCKSHKDKNKTAQSTGGKSQDKKEKQGRFGGKSKSKKNDLYSKIEEIYNICCCELCDCSPSPLSNETSSSCMGDEQNQVCLCLGSNKEKKAGDVACECPMSPTPEGSPKLCPCHDIDIKEVTCAAPAQPPATSIKKPGLSSPTPGKQNKDVKIATPAVSPKPSCGQLNSPCPGKTGKEVKIAAPDNLNKDTNIFVCSMSPKPSCGQLNSPCHAPQLKQEEVAMIVAPPKPFCDIQPDSIKDVQKDCPCHNTDAKETSDTRTCDCQTPAESPSPICSCTDSDISEDGYPTCACKTDDKEEDECPCFLDEAPITSSDESVVVMGAACKCNSCECINCPNVHKKGEESDVKGVVKKKICKCTNCLSSACRKDRNNCTCQRKRPDPNRRKRSKTQMKKYDIRRALLYANLPFNKTASENMSICDPDGLSSVSCLNMNGKCGLCDCFMCQNNLHEYENILKEVDRCGCSPCECRICQKTVTGEVAELGDRKACRCEKCDCISCSNFMEHKHNNATKKQPETLQDVNKNMQNMKQTTDDDILYEKLILLKKGEVISNFKTDKEKLLNDQLQLGINKDLPLPYLVIDKEIQLINEARNSLKQKVVNTTSKKNSKDIAKGNKNVETNNKSNINSKECLNLLIPCNSDFVQKTLMMVEPKRSNLKMDEVNTVRNIKIYIKLKNMCDNADEYIKHLRDILEKSEQDKQRFESLVEKIKQIQNACYADNDKSTIPKILELLRKETKK